MFSSFKMMRSQRAFTSVFNSFSRRPFSITPPQAGMNNLYKKLVADGTLNPDPNQVKVVEWLDDYQ
jgi:hypothetical protein